MGPGAMDGEDPLGRHRTEAGQTSGCSAGAWSRRGREESAFLGDRTSDTNGHGSGRSCPCRLLLLLPGSFLYFPSPFTFTGSQITAFSQKQTQSR